MDHEELISAALDGERVDVDALEAALAGPGGRAALASFVLLRAAVASDEDRPAPAFYESMAPVLRTGPRAWLLAGPRIPATIAASLLAVLMAASFLLGAKARPAERGVLDLVRVAGDPAAETARSATAGEPVESEPPKPARVVRFERGDWRDGS